MADFELDNKNESIRKNIVEEIMKLKFELGNIGVQYIIETILLMKNDERLYNLERDIYPIVAKKFGVSAKRVKWNINSSISAMYKNCSYSVLKSYFGYDSGRRPTPKIIIFTILRKI